jgi:type IV pilus assembly protein PilM
MTIALPAAITRRSNARFANKAAAVEYGPVGLDLGRNGLRLVQFCKHGSEIALHASACVPLTEAVRTSEKQTRALIKTTLRKHGFVGRDVISCLQPNNTETVMLSYLHQAGKQDEELIVKRMAERIEDDIQNYVIDFMQVRPDAKDGQERSVLVSMARRELVVDYLELLRKAGLCVKVLEIEPAAIRRLVSVKHNNDAERSDNLMTVSMGHEQTYITVLSGRRLIYERDLDFGEQQLIALLCKELELDEHDARSMLLRKTETSVAETENSKDVSYALYSVLKPMFMVLMEDINRALAYAASETRGMPVKQVYLTNLVATWAGIDSFMGSLIKVPVSVLMPFEDFNKEKDFHALSDPRDAVVTGMALYGLTEAG